MKASATKRATKGVHGGVVVPKNTGSNVHPGKFGGPAHGSALATRVWEETTASVSSLARYARDLLETDSDARKTFRHDLNMKKKAASAADKAAETKMTRSVFNRISELFTISKAADLGLTVAECVSAWNAKGLAVKVTADSVTFPWIVEHSRAFLKEKGAADGRGSSTARMTSTEKVQKYLLTNITPADYPAILTVVQTLAKKVKTPEQAAEALQAMKPKKEAPASMNTIADAILATPVKATKRATKAA